MIDPHEAMFENFESVIVIWLPPELTSIRLLMLKPMFLNSQFSIINSGATVPIIVICIIDYD